MDIATTFKSFLSKLEVTNSEDIISRFKKITKRLNKDFHDDLDSEEDNGLYVGSFGRDTAINGISDLDMNFIISNSDYSTYNKIQNGQRVLLQDVKASILKTYPNSIVYVDRYVVVVEFKNDFIEVCPVFEENDGSFTFPDSYNQGSWKKTNPTPEAIELKAYNITTNENLIYLCQMARAWKNKMGVKIGGLLIDTFAYDFFKSDDKYAEYRLDRYDLLVQEFFGYLKELSTERAYWHAPGSNQHVYNKNSNLKSKAKKAFKLCETAILNNNDNEVYETWRKIFGKSFPYPKALLESSTNFIATEEYIEYQHPLNIIYKLRIDCEVTQTGFRTELLRKMTKLKKQKQLQFFIDETDVPQPYTVLWKVKNEGLIAKQKNMRGQIISSNKGPDKRNESSSFEGEHFVECYIIKDGYCVARDRIEVPIATI